MAVKLIANYSKRLGLPGYSSHQFSVSVETELLNVDNVAGESGRLYSLLQKSVDEQMQNTGFVPPDGYGMEPANGNGRHQATGNGNGAWRCSAKQQNLIEKMVAEHHLDKREVENLAVEMFGTGVKQLDKLQASGLIDELIDRHGGGRRQAKRPDRRERAPVNGGRE